MAELLPAQGDQALGYKVIQMLDAILKDKVALGLPKKWNRAHELYKNKHWKNTSKKVSLATANLLNTHVNRTANMLTDNSPTFNITRIGEPENDEVYDDLLHAAEHWWIDQEQQHVLELSVKSGEINGCTIEKVVFNPDLEFGMGETETEVVDPFHFGVYPPKTKRFEKAEAVLHFRPMTVREVQRRWPDSADLIKSDKEYLSELGDERREIQGGGNKGAPKGWASTVSGVVKSFLNDAGEAGQDTEELLVVECWAKDYTMVGEGEESMPMYAGYIRQVAVCNGGEVVLEDRSNPSINPDLDIDQAAKTYLYDKFPFTLTASNVDPMTPWGISDYEQLEELQIEIDKTLSQITTLKDKAARTKIINPRDSGVKNAEFTNYPGVINPTNAMAAQGIRYMDPPQIPQDLIQGLEMYREFFFLVSGAFDLEQANAPGKAVIAHKALAELIERASVMLKGKIRNYGKMVRERGRMYLSHVMNWYTEDRYVSYSDNGEDVSRAINGHNLIVPAKLTVVSGSTMPRSRIQEREEAIGLFERGAIDSEALLDALDYSGRKEILKRMQAGPMGELFQRMGEVGVPEQILTYLQSIAEMEEKDISKALESGEMPAFQEVMQELMSQGEPEPEDPALNADLAESQAKVEETRAKIRKIMAESSLVAEKIRTEQVQQKVMIAGVKFDADKLKIERAQTIASIQQGKTAKEDSELKGKSSEKKGQGPFNEKGMVSNNKETGV